MVEQEQEANSVSSESKLKERIQEFYPELKKMAARYLRSERQGHTLQKTALAHETALKMLGASGVAVQNTQHLLALAARNMRNILVDYGRARNSAKRGGGEKPAVLRGDEVSQGLGVEVFVALNTALEELGEMDERALRVVELKHFAGFTNEESAVILGISDATVEAIWHHARLWLRRRLSAGPGPGGQGISSTK